MPRNVYKLVVSYDEAGAPLRRHVADELGIMGNGAVWEASFRNLEAAQLPPDDGVIWVYPVFMQSGRTVTQVLPERLKALYAVKGMSPEFEFKPVWGGEVMRGFDPGVNAALARELQGDASFLVVAHGVKERELPPEPHRWIQCLRLMLPEAGDMAVAYFEGTPSVEDVLPTLRGRRVVVMPFLVGEGHHMKEDMPSPGLAAKLGKELKILPPLGVFYLQAEREYLEEWCERGMEKKGDFDWPDRCDLEDTHAWYLRQFRKRREELEREDGYGVMREGAEKVIALIQKAFAGVELGNGIGLIQAEYSDGCESEDVLRGLAERDERHDWSRLADEALDFCGVSLSFTDEEGCRFLLPAFMCCDLRGCLLSCNFTLRAVCSEDMAPWSLQKTSLLNEEQRRAVEAYVEFAGSENGEFGLKLPWQW